MKNTRANIQELQGPVRALLTDIDDTLTLHGKLPASSYEALWRVQKKGIPVLAVTGRPAGWCEMMARLWPVDAVIGENGALAFAYRDGKMRRWFVQDAEARDRQLQKLLEIAALVLREVPGTALASDQFTRMFDVAIDFCEDVPPLESSAVQRIVELFHQHGAVAKVSSIHVNAWFGAQSKYAMSLQVLQDLFHWTQEEICSECVFVGDSPNDESLWQHFKKGVCVGDLSTHPQLQFPPTFYTSQYHAEGFVELCNWILKG